MFLYFFLHSPIHTWEDKGYFNLFRNRYKGSRALEVKEGFKSFVL